MKDFRTTKKYQSNFFHNPNQLTDLDFGKTVLWYVKPKYQLPLFGPPTHWELIISLFGKDRIDDAIIFQQKISRFAWPRGLRMRVLRRVGKVAEEASDL